MHSSRPVVPCLSSWDPCYTDKQQALCAASIAARASARPRTTHPWHHCRSALAARTAPAARAGSSLPKHPRKKIQARARSADSTVVPEPVKPRTTHPWHRCRSALAARMAPAAQVGSLLPSLLPRKTLRAKTLRRCLPCVICFDLGYDQILDGDLHAVVGDPASCITFLIDSPQRPKSWGFGAASLSAARSHRE